MEFSDASITIPEDSSDSDTEEYVVPPRDDSDVDIDETVILDPDDDDDLILINPVIESIDLCTQAWPVPPIPSIQFRHPVSANEVIEIIDSPLTQRVAAQNQRRHEAQNQERALAENLAGPSRRNRMRTNARADSAPYVSPTSVALNLDETLNETQSPPFRLSCPICLESVVGRNPVSTNCGHIFCNGCLQTSMRVVKKCPMCRKNLTGRAAVIPLHINP